MISMEMQSERIRTAMEKAEREANQHGTGERAIFCDGTAHGLREALRMLEEERAKW